MTEKELLKSRFEKLYPKKRLLAIQLNGFYHTIFYDNGIQEDKIQVARYSNYAPENKSLIPLGEMFEGYPNQSYQGNAKEILYIKPENK
jgi:hypothetical protein